MNCQSHLRSVRAVYAAKNNQAGIATMKKSIRNQTDNGVDAIATRIAVNVSVDRTKVPDRVRCISRNTTDMTPKANASQETQVKRVPRNANPKKIDKVTAVIAKTICTAVGFASNRVLFL
jgi:hypothetical protein